MHSACEVGWLLTGCCVICREYERTFEQNETLGLNDINVDHYRTDEVAEHTAPASTAGAAAATAPASNSDSAKPT